jgi:formate dehydrogenase alpha subunit
LAAVFGSGAATASYKELEDTDLIIAWGSNTQECHPIIFNHMRRGIKNGAKMVVIDPRKINQTKLAEKWLPVRIGTDIALANGFAHVIIEEDLYNKEFVENVTTGFEEYKKIVSDYTPEYVEQITGVPADDIRQVARMYAKAGRAMLCWTLGITEHHNGTESVYSLINLSLLTGHIGKYGSGLNPLRGQNNVQGGGDMGALPNRLTGGYHVVDDLAARQRFESVWGKAIPTKEGLHQTLMLDAMSKGQIKALYVIGENPVHSDANMEHVKHAFDQLEIIVVQDILMTKTAEIADVVLPAAGWAESDGTYTNSERRIQRIRKAVTPPGAAKDDCEIIQLIANQMGENWENQSAEEIWNEIRQVSENHAGITYERLDQELGIQWPCKSENDPGSLFLHDWLWERPIQRPRPMFTPVRHQLPTELPDGEYPLQLTTGRRLSFYNTGVQTADYGAKVKGQEESVEISPEDAAKLGIATGDLVRVASRRGSVEVKAQVTDRSREGIVFLSFHFSEQVPTNILTINSSDPIAGTAEFKACAVKIEKIG